MTEFKGIPFIKRPKDSSYNFLVGDFGREKLKEYNLTVKLEYKDNSNLKVLNFEHDAVKEHDVVKGSNHYAIFLMNKILSKQGLRTANPSDMQKIIDNIDDFLKGAYVDLGVVLRTEEGANKYLAGQLAKQAKDRKYEFSNSNPLVFKPSDLELIVDSNSPSGLGFSIKESASPFNAPELSYENDYKKFKNTTKNGVPIFDENGNRTNYAGEDGLSGLNVLSGSPYLDYNWNPSGRGSGLVSGAHRLALSLDGGRVVVMNDGGE